MDYKNDLKINKDDLANELEQHIEFCMQYGEEAANLRKVAKEAHAKVKVKRSELILKCKEDNAKATGPVVEAYYRTDKRYQRYVQDQIDAEHEADVMELAANTFNFVRTKALVEAVKLWERRYWDSPRVPFNGNLEVYDELKQRQRDRLNKREE